MKSTLRIAAAGACLSVFSFSPALAATPPSSSVQLYGLKMCIRDRKYAAVMPLDQALADIGALAA